MYQVMNDEMQKMMSILSIVPILSLGYRNLQNGREWYNLIITIILLWWLFSWNMIWVWVQSVGSYLVTIQWQRRWSGSVLLFNFILLSLLHLYNQCYHYKQWRLDVSGVVMLTLQKTTAFALQYSDVLQYSSNPNSLSQQQKITLIHIMPSFIQYLHYILFLPTLLVGPTFDYSQFKLYLSNINLIPLSYSQIFKNYIQAFILMLIYLLMQSYFDIQYLFSSEFQISFFPYRLILVMLTIAETNKYKYYSAWTINRAATIACGIAYNHHNQQIYHHHNQINLQNNKNDLYNNNNDANNNNKIENNNDNKNYNNWDKFNNVNIWEIEGGKSASEVIKNWNISTQLWLKHQVYIRLRQMGYKHAKVITFIVSAFWHGFYPGYYIAFILLSLFDSTFNSLSKTFQIPYFLSWLITRLMMPYFAAGFIILDLQSTLIFYRNTGLYFFFFSIFIFLTNTKFPKK